MQAYHACISFIDAQIGLVLDALKASGHWEDTIVVLISDHGYLLGREVYVGEGDALRNVQRVPMIFRVPRSVGKAATTPGSTSEGLVELVDLFPTLAELCDVRPPQDLQGRSLTEMLRDPRSGGKEIAYAVVTRGKRLGKAIRNTRYHYTQWPTGEELYDLEADPYERSNLANDPEVAETLERMRAHLARIEIQAASERR